MERKLTELVFILDRSGSMSGLETDTIGGFNALLEKQKAESGECTVSTILFDDRFELLHDRFPLKSISPITSNEYYVRGSTALLDAIGRTIDKIANVQTRISCSERANKVLFVIITDGMENSSREYRFDRVKEMVERERNSHGWEFLFLGANIDAIQVASQFGIKRDHAVNYCPDGEGTRLNYSVVSDAICQVRSGMPIDEKWKKRNQDFLRKTGPKE